MEELKIGAEIKNLDQVQDFVRGILETADCPAKTQFQVEVSVEEIFVNIASYAYPEGTGEAVIQAGIQGDPPELVIVFSDQGIPFDPTAREDPDITLSVEERGIGGLGIYMVKQSMNEMRYERRDGRNVLTVRKKL